MAKIADSGIWVLFVPELGEGTIYKYEVHSAQGVKHKSDPYGFYAELRPHTASIVYQIQGYKWQDQKWQREKTASYERPMLIYEVHLGSWRQRALGVSNLQRTGRSVSRLCRGYGLPISKYFHS